MLELLPFAALHVLLAVHSTISKQAKEVWSARLPAVVHQHSLVSKIQGAGLQLTCPPQRDVSLTPFSESRALCEFSEPFQANGPRTTLLEFLADNDGPQLNGIYVIAFPTQQAELRGTLEHFVELRRIATVMLGAGDCPESTECKWTTPNWTASLRLQSVGKKAILLVRKHAEEPLFLWSATH